STFSLPDAPDTFSLKERYGQPRSKLWWAEVAGPLQAIKLFNEKRDQRLAIGLVNGFQKGVFRDGSPTGILQRRSYNPREALRTIQGARLLRGKPQALQEIQFIGRVDLGRAVQVAAIPRRQVLERLSLRIGRVVRYGEVDKHRNPESQRIAAREVGRGGCKYVILPAVRQGRAQRIAACLGENVGLELIGDVHGGLPGCVVRERVRVHHAEDVVEERFAVNVPPAGRGQDADVTPVRVGVGVVHHRTRRHVVGRAGAVDAVQNLVRVDAVLPVEVVGEVEGGRVLRNLLLRRSRRQSQRQDSCRREQTDAEGSTQSRSHHEAPPFRMNNRSSQRAHGTPPGND